MAQTIVYPQSIAICPVLQTSHGVQLPNRNYLNLVVTKATGEYAYIYRLRETAPIPHKMWKWFKTDCHHNCSKWLRYFVSYNISCLAHLWYFQQSTNDIVEKKSGDLFSLNQHLDNYYVSISITRNNPNKSDPCFLPWPSKSSVSSMLVWGIYCRTSYKVSRVNRQTWEWIPPRMWPDVSDRPGCVTTELVTAYKISSNLE